MTELARTVFLGSGSFAVPVAAALIEHPSVDLMAVVTAPRRRGSRGRPTDPPVADWAVESELTMLRPSRLRDPESVSAIADLKPDILVLADYGQIVPAVLLALPRHGALNLHPSLLPRHRGASPIPAAILAGDSETGVSLMLMDAGLDTGPVIAQARRALSGSEIAPELEADLSRMAADLLRRTLAGWLDDRLTLVPQAVVGATVTRPLRREDGRLDTSQAAVQLERQVRAYQPWPGSFIDTADGRLSVWRAAAGAAEAKRGAGKLVDVDGGLGLTTVDGLLELLEVQLAGGRRMRSADLMRGRPGLIGSSVLPRAEPAPGSSA
ncbi:MAG: methionyl-tRNA formyltransferase [Candidatus Limnocylindrales bacterium]